MEAITICSTSILIICGCVHFFCHFELNHNKPTWKIIKPITDIIAFYPSLWTLYVLVLIILSLTITIVELFHIPHAIINYGIIIIVLTCWESLFSFHRYYKLKYYMTYRRTIQTKNILKRFLVFIIVYTPIFICQMILIPLLYPLVIIIYLLFNIYCEYQFVQMLLIQYSTLTSFDKLSASNIETSMIRAVYIMGCCSLISIIISTFLLYNFITISSIFLKNPSFYPLFWCLSAIFYMFNFVQNREILHKTLRQLHCTKRMHMDNALQRQETEIPNTSARTLDLGSRIKTKSQVLVTPSPMSPNTPINTHANELKRAKALELLGLQPIESNKLTPRINQGISVNTLQRGVSSSDTYLDTDAEDDHGHLSDFMENIDEQKALPAQIPVNSNESDAMQHSKMNRLDLKLAKTHALSAPSGPKKVKIPISVPRVRSETIGDGSDGMIVIEENQAAYDKDDFSETMKSWNILALYGFYSKINVNSMHQLRKYKNNMNRSVDAFATSNARIRSVDAIPQLEFNNGTTFVHKTQSEPNSKITEHHGINIFTPSAPVFKTKSENYDHKGCENSRL